MWFGKSRKEREARRELEVAAQQAGWQWAEASPPPSIELEEAAMRESHAGPIWTIGMSDVVRGVVRDIEFQSARLVGYAFHTTNSGTPLGDLALAHAVWITLPGALPEIRISDLTIPAKKDFGLRLPPLAIPPIADRFQIEGFIPQFASELLTPPFVESLASFPPGRTIVIRAGAMIAYGPEPLDADAIAAITAHLAHLSTLVPASAWGRADALTAGTGVFPRTARDGVRLSLHDRLVRRDWLGFGIQKLSWQEAASPSGSIFIKHRDSVDVWETGPGAAAQRPGLSVGFRLGGTEHHGAAPSHGIPTVASTLVPPVS